MKDAIIVETARSIPGHPMYLATVDGEIYSHYSHRVLRGGLGSNGRPIVGLVDTGKAKTHMVHTLICEAWHGPRTPGMTVSHLDGNMLNNRPENLKWESLADNHARKLEHGTSDRGFANSRACLTPETVRRIYEMREGEGKTHKQIADALGVSRPTVSRVLNGLRYA